jgi:cytochrome c oxidase cbb3-type subunit 3
MFLKNKYLSKGLPYLLCLALVSMPWITYANTETTNASTPADRYQIIRYTLIGLLLLQIAVIGILGVATRSAAKIYWEKKGNLLPPKNKSNLKTIALVLLFSIAQITGYSQDTSAIITSGPSFTIPVDLIVLGCIVVLESAIILILSRMLLHFLQPQKTSDKKQPHFWKKLSFQKLNQTVAIEEEHLLDLQHDYDGIRELDNKVPVWWRYAFYATILFGVVYIYRMFIAETMPDQIQELATANEIAAIQKAAYLKNAANNIDENNVTLLDAAGIAEGAILYNKNCLACHGDLGQGGVGPNLTDEYWLHKGGIKDIFISIKYGWPEKGMKSWKEDFSPAQLAQITSYVISLKGTNPAGAKEAQGDKYEETEQETANSAAIDTVAQQ